MRWEYQKIDLNDLPRKTEEIDLLCDAGKEGWELVAIMPNGVAYLKRLLEEATRPRLASSPVDEEEPREVKAKYRDPATGEAWSGRGLMARWLRAKHDAGEDIEKYRV